MKKIIAAVLTAALFAAQLTTVRAEDRVVVYPAQNPYPGQINGQAQNARVSQGTFILHAFNLQALGAGSGTFADLTTAPGTGLYVTVGPTSANTNGAIYQVIQTDPSPVPSVCPTGVSCSGWQTNANTTLIAAPAFQSTTSAPLGPLSAPGAGLSVYYLIEAQVQTVANNLSSSKFVNTYGQPYNATAYQGLTDQIVYQVKAGTPASSAPAIPTVDSGYIAISYVLVPNGKTQILTSDITAEPSFAGFLTAGNTIALSPSSSPSPQAGNGAIAGTFKAGYYYGDGSHIINISPSNFSTPVPQSEGGTGLSAPTWGTAGPSGNLTISGSGPNQTFDVVENPTFTGTIATNNLTATGAVTVNGNNVVQLQPSSPPATSQPGYIGVTGISLSGSASASLIFTPNNSGVLINTSGGPGADAEINFGGGSDGAGPVDMYLPTSCKTPYSTYNYGLDMQDSTAGGGSEWTICSDGTSPYNLDFIENDTNLAVSFTQTGGAVFTGTISAPAIVDSGQISVPCLGTNSAGQLVNNVGCTAAGTISGVTATNPLLSSGGTAPIISISPNPIFTAAAPLTIRGSLVVNATASPQPTTSPGDVWIAASNATGRLAFGGNTGTSPSHCFVDYGESTSAVLTAQCALTSTGAITASSFSGSASGLTSIPAGQFAASSFTNGYCLQASSTTAIGSAAGNCVISLTAGNDITVTTGPTPAVNVTNSPTFTGITKLGTAGTYAATSLEFGTGIGGGGCPGELSSLGSSSSVVQSVAGSIAAIGCASGSPLVTIDTNGNIAANGALVVGNGVRSNGGAVWANAGGTLPSCSIGGELCSTTSTTAGEIVMGGSSTSSTFDFGASAAGIFTLGAPTYVVGALAAESCCTSNTLGYVPPVYTHSGTATGASLHCILDYLTATGSTTTVNFAGAAVFTSFYVPTVMDVDSYTYASVTSITTTHLVWTSTNGHEYFYQACGV